MIILSLIKLSYSFGIFPEILSAYTSEYTYTYPSSIFHFNSKCLRRPSTKAAGAKTFTINISNIELLFFKIKCPFNTPPPSGLGEKPDYGTFSCSNNSWKLVGSFMLIHALVSKEGLTREGTPMYSTGRIKKHLHLNLFSFSLGF